MKLFETVSEMGHEQVLFCHDKARNLKAIIAIHNTNLGSAMGATRLWPYLSEADALRDVLRLSRGMTYKAACANIPMGGGKAVIIANPQDKNDELLRAYGRFVNSLNGRFITGQDVNLSPEDVRQIYKETQYVVGRSEKSGGPAPMTAMGVLLGIKAAVEFRMQQTNLEGLTVAVQGLGNVGQNLCKHLHEHKVKLFVSDIDAKKAEKMQQLYGATVVESKEIYNLDVDIFSPCALGAIINSSTIPLLKAKIIAGAANNQLENEVLHSRLLEDKGILYCPDYVINAGGLINVYHEMIGYEEEKAFTHLNSIYNTLLQIFSLAKSQEITPYEAAQKIAENRIMNAQPLGVK
ncbi:tryptophan dehydrogenase ScyB [Gloeothece verrucosa]|uniref:L-tryptophan dehydrogenase n=1 Tax=Gloeothece verrucosa (strain PCC 7822) TaxID=497965 RepID=E0UFZ7_GLOV7|nr:tryptophan dehydrogenase ScyB [Gloeothece verrucosa]ADN14380.1 Glu/Leu/Phe/Val dehydrogenase dimerization region [Gloeothece verrucosa PCC 7822]